MNKDILDEQNTMLYNGKLYELSVSRETECCQHCAFLNMGSLCPGKCNSKNGDGFWIERNV